MDNELKELNAKIEKILEVQELILEKLNQGVILPKEEVNKELATKKMSKREERNLRLKEITRDLEIKFQYGGIFQRQFNLVQEPSIERIKHYLKTNDSSAFDGLKRK